MGLDRMGKGRSQLSGVVWAVHTKHALGPRGAGE